MQAGAYADETARRLHGLLREARTDRGLDGLTGTQDLIDVAAQHSRAMARDGTLAHEVRGRGPTDRAPGHYQSVRENCAYVDRRDPGTTAHRLRDIWLSSERHRRNLLAPNMVRDGIGIWVDGGTVWATHLLAEPQREGALVTVASWVRAALP